MGTQWPGARQRWSCAGFRGMHLCPIVERFSMRLMGAARAKRGVVRTNAIVLVGATGHGTRWLGAR